jgi:hypothetical protein
MPDRRREDGREQRLKEQFHGASPSRHVGILGYWHKVEFFIPYDLQRQVLEDKDAEWSVRPLSAAQLAALSPQALWSAPVPEGRKLSGFDVYLGVFDKAELADVTRRVISASLSPSEAFDQDERGELEGLTCSASIRVGADGSPLLDDLAVSTVPWALGRIARQGLDGLDFDAFRADLEALKRDVRSFRASLPRSPDAAGQDSPPLSAAELLALLRIIVAWSGHAPAADDARAPVVVVRAKSVEDKAKPGADAAKGPPKVGSTAEGEDEDDDGEAAGDTEISILNSFFADDIARAIASIERGTAGTALRTYLTPGAEAARLDLYQAAGRRELAERLRPRHLNAGHWPDNPAHAMSLMQQFAINSVFERLDRGGILSVNGPPGTGKTTLLRDLVAENVVRRARALGRCGTAADAFQRDRATVSFEGVPDCTVAVLKDELTGFEMVVASSNNAAVENISRDLPRNKSLGKPAPAGQAGWRDASGQARVGYLQPVARNLSERNGKGAYELPRASDDDSWGLVACALGNKRNRDAFVRGLRFAGPKPNEKPPKGYDPARHQSIWHWRAAYSGPSFAEAKRAVSAADDSCSETLARLEQYAGLQHRLAGVTQASFIATAVDALAAATHAVEAAEQEYARLDEEWALSQRQLELLQAEEALIEKSRPGWWARLRDRKAQRAHDAELAANRQEQGRWIRRRYEVEPTRTAAKRLLAQAESAAVQAEAALAAREREWAGALRQREELAKQFPQAAEPPHLDELESDRWQIQGLWHSALVNEQRSALFVAALQLHEAWLAEVLKTGAGFGANIVALCHLLDGRRLQGPGDAALTLWRSLFMLVPVVSSTFASFARQFRHLGADSLGWLFIDEAGQAVPQAAVGALWRARRAVVVGDPLQIEPVFTVPIKLLEALEKTSRLPADMDVSPHRVSVQKLADEANPIGAWVGADDRRQWIGCPLRVHRRCVDPMFSIANDIAYDGKMIFFAPGDPRARLPPGDSLDTGPSAWVHAPGPASDKQVVDAQVDLVQQAVLALFTRTGKPPPIYVISPFKRIKQALVHRLKERDLWVKAAGGQVQPPTAAELRHWCKERIGTVHTFQGKEESIVWLVLGCDARSIGAAQWAAGKPNLLNVAVTRAKHRCVLIGDEALWGGLRNFTAAHARRLPRITPPQFLQRVSPP